MATVLVTGGTLKCPFGDAISKFTATNAPTMKISGQMIGTINDAAGGMNIASFGMCKSLANPAVQAATAAAMGVLTPQPCMPNTSRWIAIGIVTMNGKQVLSNECCIACAYGGTVSVVDPGQHLVSLPS